MLKDWTLTTDHSASSYGMPVFIFGDTAYGPRDRISAFRVADVVYDWAREPKRTDDEQAMAGRFLRQWPEGPQLDRVPGVRGQPQRFAKTEAVTVRLEQSDADRCPRNAKGKIEQDFMREAVSRELKRRGL